MTSEEEAQSVYNMLKHINAMLAFNSTKEIIEEAMTALWDYHLDPLDGTIAPHLKD